MKIWVFTSGEPLPDMAGKTRMLRSGNLCRFLSANGHDVVWLTSSFDHFKKVQLPLAELSSNNTYGELHLIYSTGYKSNISLARLLDHAILGINFWRSALGRDEAPDLIWCSYPPIEAAAVATLIGKKLNVPVILDVRDLWPDAFLDRLSGLKRYFLKLGLLPYYELSAYAFRRCDAIVGVTPGYVKWALQRSGKQENQISGVFPMGYPDFELSDNDLDAAHQFWLANSVSRSNFNICFFGTLGSQFDIDTVIAAATELASRCSQVRFILCGDGSSLAEFRRKTKGLSNLLFPGRVNLPQIKALMELSAVGLAPYRNTLNFQLNIPNKIFEYAAGGLPILCGVDGEIGQFLRANDAGFIYKDRSVKSLVDTIESLVKQPLDLAEKGVNARKVFCQYYESDIVSKQMVDFMQQVLVRRSLACGNYSFENR
jgi:glycosyltransferase involved in cell wall biosynthesis